MSNGVFQYLDTMHAAPKTMETTAEIPTTTQGGRKSEVSTPAPNAGRATYPNSHILQHFTAFGLSFPLPSVRGLGISICGGVFFVKEDSGLDIAAEKMYN